MASTELLKMTHSVDDRVKGVEGKVQDVCDDVQDVRGDVHDVGVTIERSVQDVDHRLQSIGDYISSGVQGVDHKLDRANRSLSLQQLLIVSSAHAAPQGTNLEKAFHDGFRPQIHPPIITMHARLTIPVQLNGFSKELYSIDGNPPDPFCGYMENVRYSWPSPSVKSWLFIKFVAGSGKNILWFALLRPFQPM